MHRSPLFILSLFQSSGEDQCPLKAISTLGQHGESGHWSGVSLFIYLFVYLFFGWLWGVAGTAEGGCWFVAVLVLLALTNGISLQDVWGGRKASCFTRREVAVLTSLTPLCLIQLTGNLGERFFFPPTSVSCHIDFRYTALRLYLV